MKRSNRNHKSAVVPAEWFQLVLQTFPELDRTDYDPTEITQIQTVCEELAYEVNEAHSSNTRGSFLSRCYDFFRWSVHRAEENELRGWIAHSFFDRILTLGNSKEKCLDYLDWGDVRVITASFTTEPDFDDEDNFERLCSEWKLRWARNQKLPKPTEFTQQIGDEETSQPSR